MFGNDSNKREIPVLWLFLAIGNNGAERERIKTRLSTQVANIQHQLLLHSPSAPRSVNEAKKLLTFQPHCEVHMH